MLFLVLNAGSSSLKFALFDEKITSVARGLVQWSGSGTARLTLGKGLPKPLDQTLGAVDYRAAVRRVQETLAREGILKSPQEVAAIGQRVVHGGTRFLAPTPITPEVVKEIESLVEIAPLHNPPALESIKAAAAAYPGVAQFAVFDTAYFQTLEPAQYVYPLPYSWYRDWGIRRFGFHGISHGDCAARCAEFLKRADLRVVSCHLGQGASVTASRGEKAVATTMGFTPLEGLMMGSRSGSIDPGIVLYVQRRHGLSAEALENLLNHEAGLRGIAGSSDFRDVQAEASAGEARAQLAIEMFADRVRAAIGAMAVRLGGVDALVFTAGIGEHSAELRRLVARGLECLRLEIDAAKNQAAKPDADISAPRSKGKVFVLRAEEERVIADETARWKTG